MNKDFRGRSVGFGRPPPAPGMSPKPFHDSESCHPIAPRSHFFPERRSLPVFVTELMGSRTGRSESLPAWAPGPLVKAPHYVMRNAWSDFAAPLPRPIGITGHNVSRRSLVEGKCVQLAGFRPLLSSLNLARNRFCQLLIPAHYVMIYRQLPDISFSMALSPKRS
jgi:hypothetical protein